MPHSQRAGGPPGASGGQSGMDGTAKRDPVMQPERRGQRKRREDEKLADAPEDVAGLAALLGQSVQALTVNPAHSDRKVLENFEKQASGGRPAVVGSKRLTPRAQPAASSSGRAAVKGAGGSGTRNKGKPVMGSAESSSKSATPNTASSLARIPRLVPTWTDDAEDIILLAEGETTVGRGADNTKAYADKMMSKRHAAFTWDGAQVTVRDMGSKNGIYVNSKKVPEQVLEVGDKVVVGSRHFRLEMPKAKTVKPKSVEKKPEESPREKTRNLERDRDKDTSALKEPSRLEKPSSGMKDGDKAAGQKKIAYDDRVSLSPAEAKIKILKLWFGITVFAFGGLLLVFLIVLFWFKSKGA